MLASAGWAAPSFQQVGNTLVMSNGNVRLEYNLAVGTADFYWSNSRKIAGFYSGVTLSTGYIKGTNYTSWSYALSASNQVVVTAQAGGLPTMKQYFTLDQPDSFLLRVDMVGASLSANWMGPIVVDSAGGVNLGVANDNRALCVPFDNDHFVRYNAPGINTSSISYEVGAFYDNTTRNGLVVGSVTHDTWKTGVFFNGANNKLNQMNVYGGAASPSDTMAHGSVSGNTLSSPTIFVGFGSDWRVTMANYAAANTNVVPLLPWNSGMPFGWNSWGVLQQYVTYDEAIAVSDFLFTHLEGSGFINHNTVYVNLDSFWDNLSGSELVSFVSHCHVNGQKAGIYWGPFVWWGSAADATNSFVEGTTNAYRYSDILLRNSKGNFETNDGALAIDPTHPGARWRMAYWLSLFNNYGFDFIKLDFLSHGSQEGLHYDPRVTTGIQAYNQGMQYVLSQLNSRMFISASIAPLFPYQYFHSRRIACDAQTSRIGDTEYTMNSVSYGWWLNGVYAFNDPDLMVFGNGSDTNEMQSRLISGAVTGLFLNGDDLTSASGQSAAQTCLTKTAINAVARAGRTFAPIEANTGSSAADLFVRQDGSNWCIAIFNYGSTNKTSSINLSRAGLPAGFYVATNLWDGSAAVVSGSFSVSLNPKQSKLFALAPRQPANLSWNANSAAQWDSATTANWKDQASGRPSAFYAGDQVLFDDTAGVPTAVSVAGTVSPGTITVNSSANNYTFSGSGLISGSGGLFKSGASTLTLKAVGNLTGPVTIAGGTVAAAGSTLTSVASITVTNNATLDFAANAMGGGKPISVSGAGVNGQGALFNSQGALYDQVLAITLIGDVTFGTTASSRWDLGSGSSLAGPYKVTINNANGGYGEWDTVQLGATLGDIEIAQGMLGIKGMGNSLGNPASAIWVDSGTQLCIWNSAYGTNSGYARSIHVQSNAVLSLMTSPNTFFNANVTLENGAEWQSVYGSGSQTMNGTCALNGIAHFQIQTAPLVFSNVISGSGGLVWDASNNDLVFCAANTYRGPTLIGAGLKLRLVGPGAAAQSALIFFGGTDSASVRLDAGGRPDMTLTLANGQTLAGIGRVQGGLVVSAGATLAPAGTNTVLGITTGAVGTGTISVSNDIVLQGTTVIKLNGPANDMIQSVSGGIACGGTLSLVNIGSGPLAAGSSYQILSAQSCSGAFTNIIPTAPGDGLAWDTTQLNRGRLGVVARPVLARAQALGDKLVLRGTNGTTNGNYVLLTATNLGATPMAWTPVQTNAFDTNGGFSITNPLNPAEAQRFYRLQLR